MAPKSPGSFKPYSDSVKFSSTFTRKLATTAWKFYSLNFLFKLYYSLENINSTPLWARFPYSFSFQFSYSLLLFIIYLVIFLVPLMCDLFCYLICYCLYTYYENTMVNFLPFLWVLYTCSQPACQFSHDDSFLILLFWFNYPPKLG